MRQKLTCCLLSLCLLPGLALPVSASFTDTDGHWAEPQIEAWAQREIVLGYDGKFMPDDLIRRGDMATIIDRLMRYAAAEENPFPDITADAYYAQPVRNLYHAGVMLGNENRALPDDPASRQEAIVMLARAFRLQGQEQNDPLPYPDAAEIAPWALTDVSAFTERGYLHGDDKGMLRPTEPISRAEFVTVLGNMIAELLPGDKAAAGTDGMVFVNQPGVALKDRETGIVFIAPGVGDGTVTLENVVADEVYVLGGGEHSIIIRGDSRIRFVQIARQDSGVRVLVSGNAQVEVVQINDGCNDVILSGPIGTVVVDSAENTVRLADARIGNLVITGEGAAVSVDKGSVVGRLTVAESASGATVDNAGQIGAVSIENPSARVSGVGTGGSSGGSSGGGGSSGSGSSGGGNEYNPPDPSMPNPPAPVQTIFGLTIHLAGHGIVRAEEVKDPTPIPAPINPTIDPERDGYLLTAHSVGQGVILAEVYVEPVTPRPESGEFILRIEVEGKGTVVIEEAAYDGIIIDPGGYDGIVGDE